MNIFFLFKFNSIISLKIKYIKILLPHSKYYKITYPILKSVLFKSEDSNLKTLIVKTLLKNPINSKDQFNQTNKILNEYHMQIVNVMHCYEKTHEFNSAKKTINFFFNFNQDFKYSKITPDLNPLRSQLTEIKNSITDSNVTERLLNLNYKLNLMSKILLWNRSVEIIGEFSEICIEIIETPELLNILKSKVFDSPNKANDSSSIFNLYNLFNCNVKNGLDINKFLESDLPNSVLLKKNLIALEEANIINYESIIKKSLIMNGENSVLKLINYCFSLFNLNIINEKALKDLFPPDATLYGILTKVPMEAHLETPKYLNRAVFSYAKILYLLNTEAYYNGIETVPWLFEKSILKSFPNKFSKLRIFLLILFTYFLFSKYLEGGDVK